jgi:transposase
LNKAERFYREWRTDSIRSANPEATERQVQQLYDREVVALMAFCAHHGLPFAKIIWETAKNQGWTPTEKGR